MMNKYNVIRVTRNELSSVNLVSGSRVVVDETALVYNRVISGLVSDGIVSRSYFEFSELSLVDVVVTPVLYKNAVFAACIEQEKTASENKLESFLKTVEKSEARAKELESKRDVFGLDPEENTEYLKLRAFLLTSEDVRMDLVNRRDALRNAYNEISGIISPVYVSQVKGTGKQLLHFELFCSLASSNVSDWKKVFEKPLQSAQLYRHELGRTGGETTEDTKKLYLSFRSEMENLFSRFSVTKSDGNKVLASRSIRMSPTELNNLATLVSGFDIEQDGNGKFLFKTVNYKKFERVLVKAIVLKKQGSKFEIKGNLTFEQKKQK